jgi:hypothetical protein
MSTRRKSYNSSKEQIIDFVIGSVGWFLINSAAWLLTGAVTAETYGMAILVLLPLNVIALIVFLIIRRWIGYGILAALSLNLLFSLVIGAMTNATCAIPFWVPYK